MSLVTQIIDTMNPIKPKADSDKFKRLSTNIKSLSDQLTTRGYDNSGEEIVLEYETDSYDSHQQMLWIDGVGGYLLCHAEELSLGQPTSPSRSSSSTHQAKTDSNSVHVSILADLSTNHAKIRREPGGYLITPRGKTLVNDKEIDSPTLLNNGSVIQLGNSVKLEFIKPHALSASGKLTLISGHRCEPANDGILMMAESCVLGPKSHSHLPCAKWKDELILFRGSEGLLCRGNSPISHNGEPVEQPVRIQANSRVEGQDFSFSVEGLVKR